MHDPNPPQTKTLKNCPLCDYTSDKKQLYQHFEKCHETIVVTELIEFPSFEHFMTWKVTLENDTKTNFIRGYTQQTKYYDEVILFVCHRSGHHFPKTKNIKFKNDVITKKIGGFCPASIKMMKKMMEVLKFPLCKHMWDTIMKI
ncbi:hypothetical protein HHI36_015157 [Cryptolaemus montrouzieri]|uniref:Uncharacterized protein n=1 Tax=Cryptolaemus montrouzieri TaxID=559131 RepID=A0ABD2N538_9CUCU